MFRGSLAALGAFVLLLLAPGLASAQDSKPSVVTWARS